MCSCVSIILSLRREEQKRQKSDGIVRTIKIWTAAVARLLLGFYVQACAFASHAVSPLVTDDADTVEAGKLQLNCDFQFVRTNSTSLYLVPINPGLGLTPRLELGAIFGYQWRDGSGSIPTTNDADDLTDLIIAPKVRLWEGLDDKLKSMSPWTTRSFCGFRARTIGLTTAVCGGGTSTSDELIQTVKVTPHPRCSVSDGRRRGAYTSGLIKNQQRAD